MVWLVSALLPPFSATGHAPCPHVMVSSRLHFGFISVSCGVILSHDVIVSTNTQVAVVAVVVGVVAVVAVVVAAAIVVRVVV